MKISGFTIIRNAIINDYPIVEAIKSLLPVVDEMIVLCGDSEDGTTALIESIEDPKIKIHHSIWNMDLRKGGEILAIETNKAFDLIGAESDWAFYIQADEVVHEGYYENIHRACLQYKDDLRVDGLLFNYFHFFGSFDYVGDSRQWYDHEVRVIRNDKAIRSYRDAQGFRVVKKKLRVQPVEAYIYHYGYVKTPAQMKLKISNTGHFWNENTDEWKAFVKSADVFNFENFDSLAKFTGSHPTIMKERIRGKNWNVNLDISKKKFSTKDAILYYIEKKTGRRLFDFHNYTII